MVAEGQTSVTTPNHQLQQLPLQLQQQQQQTQTQTQQTPHQVVLDASQLAEGIISAADVVKIEVNSVQSDCEFPAYKVTYTT